MKFIKIFKILSQIFSLIEIDEEEMKSTNGKEIWRNWIMKYEKRVSDYNFGTLLRKNVDGDYTEENTMFVTRMQQEISKA
ncbi:unnamed protein product [Rhizophagus irregularis]|nr:unnamed protein product [Rhizophagus irregularis]